MVDVLTVIVTAVFTGLGVSIGNILFEIYFKDYFKAYKRKHKKHMREMKKRLSYKQPWLAATFNFFCWGTGYIYTKKKTGMGILLIFVWLFIGSGFIISENNVHAAFEGITYLFMTTIISGYLALDAYKMAKERNAEREEKK